MEQSTTAASQSAARASLRTVLDPKSVAIVGASENPHKIGGRPLLYLNRFGYKGRVFPINPKREEVQGYKAYADLTALPEAPEVAIIVVPGDAAIEAVEQSARVGAKVAVVMTSGFGETGTPEGIRNQQHMVDVGRKAGMRVIGPNTQGLASFGSGAVLSFSTMFIEAPPQDGPIAIISQSGAMSVVPYGMLREKGLGMRYVHATGNDSDVSVPELASVVAEDPDLRLLLLYLETIRDPVWLAETARIARARGLPVIALKSGRTPAGQEAARSHTGALANEDRVVEAFLEKHGIWRARDIGEMVRTAELYLKGWRPCGRRLVAISNSGAICVMAADAATAVNMPMATLAAETKAGLAAILPSFATTSNPVDITAALLNNSRLFSDILPVLGRDAAADAFLIGIPVSGQGYDVDAMARDTAVFAEQTGKPVVMAIPQPNIVARFKAAGLSCYVTETEAVAALNQYLSHHELMQRVCDPALPPKRSVGEQARMLNEAESLALLSRHGVPVVDHRLCSSAEEAVQALQSFGGSVVVKGCSADVVHKSELGIVRIGVSDPATVLAAFADIEHRLRAAGMRFDGVIVAKMARGRRELMLGARIDAVFGPVVVIGDGGKYVEALPDVQLLLPPFDAGEVKRALSRLRIAPLLAGVRGEAAMDVEAFCAAAVAIGRLMLDGAVVNLDVNPVLVGSSGDGCYALDGVVYLGS